MKRLLLIFAASLSSALASVPFGQEITRGNITVTVTAWSNNPFPDMENIPSVPLQLQREGVMVTLRSSNQSTSTYVVTIRYQFGGAINTVTRRVARTDTAGAPDSTVIFYVGQVQLLSIKVDEQATTASSEFTQ